MHKDLCMYFNDKMCFYSNLDHNIPADDNKEDGIYHEVGNPLYEENILPSYEYIHSGVDKMCF